MRQHLFSFQPILVLSLCSLTLACTSGFKSSVLSSNSSQSSSSPSPSPTPAPKPSPVPPPAPSPSPAPTPSPSPTPVPSPSPAPVPTPTPIPVPTPSPSPEQTYIPPAGSPLANHEHPRLFLTKDNIPQIRARLGGIQKNDYQAFVNTLDSDFATAKDNDQYHFLIRMYAFVYRVGAVTGISYTHTISEYGSKGVELLTNLASGGVAPGGSEGDVKIHLLTQGYDWLFDLLSPAQRSSVVAMLKKQEAPTAGARNPFHHREIKDRMLYILPGLAYAFDGIDDVDAQTRLNKYSSYISSSTGTLPASNFIAGSDGGVSVGTSYAVNGVSDGLIMSVLEFTESWRTANGLSMLETYSGDGQLRYYSQWMAYSVLPYPDLDGYTFYATHQCARGATANALPDLAVSIASMRFFKDIDPEMASLAEWMLENRTGSIPMTGITGYRSALLGNFIFNPGGVTPKSLQDLNKPLSKIFENIGWMTSRTGWGNNDTLVTFIASPYTRSPGYANFDHGSFTIDRNGPLAISSGNGPHHSYSDRAEGHNMIIFPDPNETPAQSSWPEYFDYGGTRSFFYPLQNILDLIPGSDWDIGGIKRRDLFDGTPAHDYDYVYADVTRAYNSPSHNDGGSISPIRIGLNTRQMVVFRHLSPTESDRIIVFDRTRTTDLKFEKRWLLHPPGREDGTKSFVVNGASSILQGQPVRNGSGEGKKTYVQPNFVSITNTDRGSNGQLFWKPLLPNSYKIVEVGGPDSSNQYRSDTSHEFEDPYGVTGYVGYSMSKSQYVGHYRLELTPTNNQLSENFLNVLEATTPAQGTMSPVAKLDGSGFVGARVGNRIAAFSSAESLVASGSITVDLAGTYRILFNDLTPNTTYIMSWDGSSIQQRSGSAGTMYVEITVGANSVVSLR